MDYSNLKGDEDSDVEIESIYANPPRRSRSLVSSRRRRYLLLALGISCIIAVLVVVIVTATRKGKETDSSHDNNSKSGSGSGSDHSHTGDSSPLPSPNVISPSPSSPVVHDSPLPSPAASPGGPSPSPGTPPVGHWRAPKKIFATRGVSYSYETLFQGCDSVDAEAGQAVVDAHSRGIGFGNDERASGAFASFNDFKLERDKREISAMASSFVLRSSKRAQKPKCKYVFSPKSAIDALGITGLDAEGSTTVGRISGSPMVTKMREDRSKSYDTADIGIEGVDIIQLSVMAVDTVTAVEVSATTIEVSLADAVNEGRFVQFSDVHYLSAYSDTNPGPYQCTVRGTRSPPAEYGLIGCDAPAKLAESALSEAMKTVLSPAGGAEGPSNFALFIGDYTQHDGTGWGMCVDSVMYLRSLWDNLDTKPKGFAVLGNNDVYPDYITDMGHIEGITAAMGDWVPDFEGTGAAGFYSTSVPGVAGSPGHQIIGLNTVLWSSKNTATSQQDDPAQEIAWLEKRLKDSREAGVRVIIVGHIPPGLSAHDASELYRDGFRKAVTALFVEYADTISLIVCAHTHMDEFRVLSASSTTSTQTPVAITLVPAVSPMFGNYPGVRVYRYDRHSLTVLGWEQYYLPIDDLPSPKWKLSYTSDDTYGLKQIDGFTMEKLAESMKSDKNVRDKYSLHRRCGTNGSNCGEACSRRIVCAIKNFDRASYDACVRTWKV